MKNRIFPFLLLSLATVALVAVFFGRNRPVSTAAVPESEPAAAAQAEVPSPQRQAPQAPTNAFATYHWQIGDRASWQFGVSLRMVSGPEKIAGSGGTRVGGRLQLVVLNADSQRVTLAAALSDAWFDVDGHRIGRYEEFFNATPAILTLSPAGNLLEVALRPEVATEDRNMLRLAYGWEFVARNAASYQEAEHAPDSAGSHFRAAYRRSDAIHLYKSRLFQASTAPEGDAMQNVVASEFTATVGKLWVSEMSGWEDTVMYLNENVLAASRISVSFKAETNSAPLAPVLFTLLSNPAAAAAFSKTADPIASSRSESVAQAVRREALTGRWGAVPFDQVLESLQKLAEGTMQELAKPMKDFDQWLAVHPDEGPTKVLQSLQSLPADQTSLSGLLVNGLADADTAQARQALASILGAIDAFPPTTAIQAAVAAGDFGEKMPPALKETLAQLMDSPLSDGSYQMSDTALFSFARIAKDDPAAREQLVQRVAPWLEANAGANDTVKALSALANAAVDDPHHLERAAEFARSADADIRFAVVEYLGSLPSTSPGRAMIDQLASDPDERIQTEVERLRNQP